jgi:hypothetical protein
MATIKLPCYIHDYKLIVLIVSDNSWRRDKRYLLRMSRSDLLRRLKAMASRLERLAGLGDEAGTGCLGRSGRKNGTG